MGSPLAQSADLVASLLEAVRRSDWTAAQEFACSLVSAEVPSNYGEMAVYADQLDYTLALTREARAELTTLLCRVRAAASFGATGMETTRPRQNFGDAPNF